MYLYPTAIYQREVIRLGFTGWFFETFFLLLYFPFIRNLKTILLQEV